MAKLLVSRGAALNPSLSFYYIAVICLVTGTLFLMWLGEQMTERGIGNGASLLIFVNIVATLPRSLGNTIQLAQTDQNAVGGIVILGLVFLNILLISFIQWHLFDDAFSLSLFWNEYVTFFIFQKAHIYTFGYSAIAIILQLSFAKEDLQIKVEELSVLKANNKELYDKLRRSNQDNTSILTIKIGNKKTVVPVSQIEWIEADDYCVKVHTVAAPPLSMRSSLKSLESNLGGNFLRVHRKAIVNLDYVKELTTSKNPSVLLSNDQKIPISQNKLKTVKEIISSFS